MLVWCTTAILTHLFIVEYNSTLASEEISNFNPPLPGNLVNMLKASKPNDTPSSVLGLYRITLWIIVLILTVFSMVITSDYTWISLLPSCKNYY